MTVAAAAPETDRERFMRAWEAFFRTSQRARARANQAQEDGLTLSQFHLLDRLAGGPQGVKALADLAGVAPPTATRMLDGFVRDGLVRRDPHPADRRCVRVSLTSEGRRALARKRRGVERYRARIAERLTADERRQAAVLLKRLAEIVEEEL